MLIIHTLKLIYLNLVTSFEGLYDTFTNMCFMNEFIIFYIGNHNVLLYKKMYSNYFYIIVLLFKFEYNIILIVSVTTSSRLFSVYIVE